MVFAVIGLENENIDGNFKDYIDSLKLNEKGPGHVPLYPGSEYLHVGKFPGYILSSLRISLGDFNFVAPQYLQ